MLNTHCLLVSIGQLVTGTGESCTYEWVHLTVVSCCGKGMKHLCLMPLKLCQMASPDRSTRWVLQTGSSLYLVICTASLSNTNKTSVSIQLWNPFLTDFLVSCMVLLWWPNGSEELTRICRGRRNIERTPYQVQNTSRFPGHRRSACNIQWPWGRFGGWWSSLTDFAWNGRK